MYLGHYSANFDNQKGRTAMPRVFARQLGERAIVTKGYEGSLIIIDVTNWEKVVSEVTNQNFLSGLARQTDRFLLGNAFEIEFDKQGRFIVPVKLREYAHLGKDIIFAGVGNHIEIWDSTAWEKNDNYLNENITEISDRMSKKNE